MDVQLLRDPEVSPTDEVLNQVLGDDIYKVLNTFINAIESDKLGLNVEWRYYNDGKAWLGKTVFKKKTIFWLSIWEGFFRIGFFFTEKHMEGISDLDIAESIKENFAQAKPIGRLIPMIIDVADFEKIDDLYTIISFKKSLK